MNLTAQQSLGVTPSQIAQALAEATPDEFADVWLEFSALVDKDVGKLDELAQAMSPHRGGNRKKVLRDILAMVTFYEEVERRNALNKERATW